MKHAELAAIHGTRGLDAGLASQVATQLLTHDALGAHARDELGISDSLSARPVQAAFAPAGSFAVGAALPLALVFVVPPSALVWVVSGSSLLFLALLGSRRGRAGRQVRGARHLLGRTGDGADRRCRNPVWGHALNAGPAKIRP